MINFLVHYLECLTFSITNIVTRHYKFRPQAIFYLCLISLLIPLQYLCACYNLGMLHTEEDGPEACHTHSW